MKEHRRSRAYSVQHKGKQVYEIAEDKGERLHHCSQGIGHRHSMWDSWFCHYAQVFGPGAQLYRIGIICLHLGLVLLLTDVLWIILTLVERSEGFQFMIFFQGSCGLLLVIIGEILRRRTVKKCRFDCNASHSWPLGVARANSFWGHRGEDPCSCPVSCDALEQKSGCKGVACEALPRLETETRAHGPKTVSVAVQTEDTHPNMHVISDSHTRDSFQFCSVSNQKPSEPNILLVRTISAPPTFMVPFTKAHSAIPPVVILEPELHTTEDFTPYSTELLGVVEPSRLPLESTAIAAIASQPQLHKSHESIPCHSKHNLLEVTPSYVRQQSIACYESVPEMCSSLEEFDRDSFASVHEQYFDTLQQENVQAIGSQPTLHDSLEVLEPESVHKLGSLHEDTSAICIAPADYQICLDDALNEEPPKESDSWHSVKEPRDDDKLKSAPPQEDPSTNQLDKPDDDKDDEDENKPKREYSTVTGIYITADKRYGLQSQI